jgi:NADPH-dependent glutamate synthase beta subunit-like oxidoreductase
VAVIGGGNAAIDSARTALRLGGREVEILYRRTEKEMPADPEEIRDALAEGIRIEGLVKPRSIARPNGFFELVLSRMRLGKRDDSGRPRPEDIPGSEFSREFDTIIAAIGQTPEGWGKTRLETRSGNRIKVDPETQATDLPGIYAAGDAVTGPASVIEAIAGGRKAAAAIDRFLGGSGNLVEAIIPPETEAQRAWAKARGSEEEALRPPLRKDLCECPAGIFAQVEKSYSRAQARKEARRCLQCDLEET